MWRCHQAVFTVHSAAPLHVLNAHSCSRAHGLTSHASTLSVVTNQEYWLLQVAVAQQIYDYVDQRIRRLDKDLKAFDAELTKDRLRQGLPVSSYPHPSLVNFTCCALQSGNYTLQLVCPHAQLCCRYHCIDLLLSYALMGFSTHSGA